MRRGSPVAMGVATSAALLLGGCGISTEPAPTPLTDSPAAPVTTPTITQRPSPTARPAPTSPTAGPTTGATPTTTPTPEPTSFP